MNRCAVFMVLIVTLSASAATAQSPEVLDQVVAEAKLSFGSAAYLALASASPGDLSPSPEAAAVRGAELLGRRAAPDPEKDSSFGEFAFLLMQAHNVPGGVMYSLIPSPRYAAREAVYREWTSRSRAPGSSISGQEALQILNRFLIWKEESL